MSGRTGLHFLNYWIVENLDPFSNGLLWGRGELKLENYLKYQELSHAQWQIFGLSQKIMIENSDMGHGLNAIMDLNQCHR